MRALLLVVIGSLALVCSGTVAAAEPKPRIEGIVKDAATGEPIEFALVVVNCTCLGASREALTDERGRYRFAEPLPTGNYTVEVLTGVAHVSKIFNLPREGKMRVNYVIDRDDPEPIVEVIARPPSPERSFDAVVRRPSTARTSRVCVLTSSGCHCGPVTEFAFGLGRSLFDDGHMHWITGGPRVSRSLL